MENLADNIFDDMEWLRGYGVEFLSAGPTRPLTRVLGYTAAPGNYQGMPMLSTRC